MIYTSYFGNCKELRKYGIEPVAISRTIPKNFDGQWLISLAPTWQMLKMSDEDYDRYYDKILERNDRDEIANKFKDKDVALLCWEKDINQCHRKKVAEWLIQGGYEVKEFAVDEKKDETVYEQLSMF